MEQQLDYDMMYKNVWRTCKYGESVNNDKSNIKGKWEIQRAR